MISINKTILTQANDAIAKGDNEGFLSFCTDDTVWEFIGDRILRGKQAVREWMKLAYKEPPQFKEHDLVEENDLLIALGDILVKDENGKEDWYRYCDVWRFRDGKMAELKAFVMKP